MRVVGVYNAKGSVWGELNYIFKKLSGQGSCSLCDLTHGWSPTPKRSWRDACAQSPIQLTLLHLDELTEDQQMAFTEAPVILNESQGKWQVLMNAEELALISGGAEELLKKLESRLNT